jgi:hypothetical protein
LKKLELFQRKKIITGKSVERMRKSRNIRKETVAHLDDENVRRIAAELLKLSKTQKYVIIPNVVSSSLTPLDTAATGKIECITFSSSSGPYLRSMQAVSTKKFPLYIRDVVAAVNVVFPLCRTVKLKILKSQAGDTPQTTHTNYVPGVMKMRLANLQEFHYSAVISIEESSKILVGKSRSSVDIPLHGMIFFRGDMLHAGAGYHTDHSRLFMSVSSRPFPATNDVSLLL